METYPKDEPELHALFANGEVDFTITQAAVGAGALIAEGLVPDTAKAFVFDDNMIGDVASLATAEAPAVRTAVSVTLPPDAVVPLTG